MKNDLRRREDYSAPVDRARPAVRSADPEDSGSRRGRNYVERTKGDDATPHGHGASRERTFRGFGVSRSERPADAPAEKPMTKLRAEELLDGAMKLSVSSSDSDDYVRDNITPEVLEYATPEQKAHMLRCLMDGVTGDEDERAMLAILQSAKTPDELMKIMKAAGGTEKVLDELGDQKVLFLAGIRGRGEEGAKLLARMAASFDPSSSTADDFVREEIDESVLAQATPEQKAKMLRSLIDGPTGADDEAAMLRILQSVKSRAELEKVLDKAGGADVVWSELEDQQGTLIADLKSRGEDGQKMIVGLAVKLSVDSSVSDDFIRDHIGADELARATSDEKAQMLERLCDGVLSADDRAAAMNILGTAKDTSDLLSIAEKGAALEPLLGLKANDKTLVEGVLAVHPELDADLKSVLLDPKFIELSGDAKTALLTQASNYPDARSIKNMQRLVQKDWFQDMGLDDQQRSLKTIAYLSQHAGDRTIIENTLDRFLAPDAAYRFDWKEKGTAYGSGLDEQFHFNRRFLPEGNDPVNVRNDDTLHMVTHTVAHEVSHLVHDDRVRETAQYFMGEYRAYYVGFKAQHGREPSREEMLERARGLLSATEGAYNSIRLALQDPVEGPQIVSFMKQVLGRNDVTKDNAATIGAIDGHLDAPKPPAGHDLDN